MAWMQPKTDWKVRYDEDGSYAGDYLNAEDFERIRQNIEYVTGEAQELYFAIPDAGIPQVTNSSFGLASTIDSAEQTLRRLYDTAYKPEGVPEFKNWGANDFAPTFEDLNRWESLTELMHKNLELQSKAKQKLSITLGGVQF